jgi:hypothetical protein
MPITIIMMIVLLLMVLMLRLVLPIGAEVVPGRGI